MFSPSYLSNISMCVCYNFEDGKLERKGRQTYDADTGFPLPVSASDRFVKRSGPPSGGTWILLLRLPPSHHNHDLKVMSMYVCMYVCMFNVH